MRDLNDSRDKLCNHPWICYTSKGFWNFARLVKDLHRGKKLPDLKVVIICDKIKWRNIINMFKKSSLITRRNT